MAASTFLQSAFRAGVTCAVTLGDGLGFQNVMGKPQMAQDAVAIIEGEIYGAEQAFAAVSVDRSIKFDTEASFAMQSICASDYALKVALANRQSVINAVTNIAAIGISLNPAKKQAYLVPRDGKICLDISYMGLMDLAMQGGSIRWAQCQLVHANDKFILNGLDKQPIHEYSPFADRGEVVGVYCTVKTSDGDYLTHCMQIADVLAIRDRSQSWKSGKTSPWKTDPGEMIKKTCVKQAYKYWPKTDRLEQAIHHVNVEGEGIDFDREKPTGIIGTGKPTDGAMEAMDRETQVYLREFAEECKAIFENAGVAACFDRIKADELDNDQTVAFWTLLPSHIRSALKAEGAERKAAQKAIAA
jgi:recombination protein RecT